MTDLHIAPALSAAGSDDPGDDVVLLDVLGRPSGRRPRATVHNRRTPLHLAFSCYVFDPGMEAAALYWVSIVDITVDTDRIRPYDPADQDSVELMAHECTNAPELVKHEFARYANGALWERIESAMKNEAKWD